VLGGAYNAGSGAIDSRNFEQSWTLDQLGNWPTFKQRDTDTGGTWDLDQDRTHNAANELTEIDASSTHVAEDDAGNMTKVPKPDTWSAHFDLQYDAWNRLVRVVWNDYLFGTYEYDGLGRRIVRGVYDAPAHQLVHNVRYYYNEQWQILEERAEVSSVEGDSPLARYVWHPYYIDALALRFHDADADGNLSENNDGRHYYAQDANYHVTTVVSASGAVLERYSYTPYGEPTVLDADFTADSVNDDGYSDIDNRHLYTGREFDWDSGLQLNRHRYYASHLGRWITRDPIDYKARTWNLYEYVSGAPIAKRDGFGLFPVNTSPDAGVGTVYNCDAKQTSSIAAAANNACDCIEKAHKLLTNCSDEVQDFYEQNGGQLGSMISTDNGMRKMSAYLDCAYHKCTGEVFYQCEEGWYCCPGEREAYVVYQYPFGGFGWAFGAKPGPYKKVIHLCPLFFHKSNQDLDDDIAHELGRLCELGEENTGSWQDVYVWDGILDSLCRNYDTINQKCEQRQSR
jgi:RHS repeat-associated protein